VDTSLTRSIRRFLLVALPLAVVAALVTPAVSQAAIAKVQTGTLVNTASSSLALTLSSASTSGNLLVATVENGTSGATFSGPSGWVRAVGGNGGGTTNPGRAEIWYYANNPGGISSATFTASGASHVQGQLSEWSGVATSSPLDVTGTATAAAATSVSVSTSSSTSASGDVGITAFGIGFNKSQGTTFTAGSGWTNLGNDGTTSQADSYSADYKLSLAAAVASETEMNNKAGGWAAVIAAFKVAPTCSGGSLTLSAASSASFSAVTLDGTNQTVSTTLALTPDDETGSGSGWNVTGTSTAFSDGSGHNLSSTATSVTAASVSAGSPNCSLPTNSIGYPVTLPAGAGPPTAVKVYNAAAATGKGQQSLTLTFQLAVPANTFHGTYNSTWTFAIVSGP
jgi:hypothetical protein